MTVKDSATPRGRDLGPARPSRFGVSWSSQTVPGYVWGGWLDPDHRIHYPHQGCVCRR